MKQLFAISLSLLLLAGNMGITLSTHFCGEEAMDTALSFGKAEISCGMEDDSAPCEIPQIQKKSCCDDTYQSMSIDDEFDTLAKTLDVNPIFLAAFVDSYLVDQSQAPVRHFTAIPPPLLTANRQVLFQSFLI